MLQAQDDGAGRVGPRHGQWLVGRVGGKWGFGGTVSPLGLFVHLRAPSSGPWHLARARC